MRVLEPFDFICSLLFEALFCLVLWVVLMGFIIIIIKYGYIGTL